MIELILHKILNSLKSCPLETAAYGLVTLVLLYLAQWLISKNRKLPPGPIGLPIVGYLPFLGKKPHVVLEKLTKKYGNVYSLYLGRQYVVVLNDHVSVKEALNNSSLLGRPDISPIHFTRRRSISVVNGQEWQEQKNFITYLLRDIGLGKSFMESHVKDEMLDFFKILDREVGKPCDVHSHLLRSTCNVITALVFGRRFSYDDPKKKFLDDNLKDLFSVFGRTAAYSFMPWLTKIFVKFGFLNFNKAKKSIEQIHILTRKELEDHKKTVDPNKIRDFIDGFILEMEKGNSFTEEMLLGNIQTLFKAGSETIRIAIAWSLLTMATYPDIQKKVQEEIDKIIGKDSYPSWSDHWNMPYTSSVLMETLRWRTAVPMNLLRYALEDTVVKGYHIPKGTKLLVSLWNVHNDPSYWENPNQYCAERFLNAEKNAAVKMDAFMPFSIGKRSCPADSLARVEVFLYFTYILQRYNVSFPKGFVYDMEGEAGIFYQPNPYKLCFNIRKN